MSNTSNTVYGDLRKANDVANKACGQITCTPNGALDLVDDGGCYFPNTVVPDRVEGGSTWLCKSVSGKVYAVSASHVLDSDDAYLNSYNIIGSHVFKGQSGANECDYVYKSVEGQCKLYLFTTSRHVRVTRLKAYSADGCRLWSLQCDPEDFDTYTEMAVNSTENNVLHPAYGIPANTVDEFDNRYGWDVTCSNTLKPSCGMSDDPADLNFCIGSLDLDQFSHPVAYIKYKFHCLYGDNDEDDYNQVFYVMTRGQKLPRWTNNMLTENGGFHDTSFMNNGMINGLFPNSSLGAQPVPLQVVGGDHRSDIVIMRPNFESLATNVYDSDADSEDEYPITEKKWDEQSAIKIEKLTSINTGDSVCTIGNPEWILKNSLTAGHVRTTQMKETSYVPSNSLMTDIIPIHGMSGGPILSRSGSAVGIFTFGIGSVGTNMSGGANCDILSKVFNHVTSTFELSGEFTQINMPKNYLGADFYDFSLDYDYDTLAAIITKKKVTGLYVDAIDENGPLSRAGLYPGCILLSATYNSKNKPSQVVTVNFGIGNSNKSIFEIIYNTDILNNIINVTYYDADDYLCINTSDVILDDSYENHSDYYFGDTAYKMSLSSKKLITVNGKQTYVTNTERSGDAYVQNTTVLNKSNKKSKVLTKKRAEKLTNTKIGKIISALSKDPEDPEVPSVDPLSIKTPFVKPAKKTAPAPVDPVVPETTA